MPSDTMSPLVVVLASLVGSGLGTTIIGALFKKRFDAQLETHKALLQRSGKIHEKQVDSLLVINSKLDEALFYLKRAASAGKFAGESDEVLLRRMFESLGTASTKWAESRLLFSGILGKKLDEFFDKMLSSGMTLRFALDTQTQDGQQRAKWWDEARDAAHKEIPSLLNAIRDEARVVIHG